MRHSRTGVHVATWVGCSRLGRLAEMAETAVLDSHELFLSALLCDACEQRGVQARKLLRLAAVIGDVHHEVAIGDA